MVTADCQNSRQGGKVRTCRRKRERCLSLALHTTPIVGAALPPEPTPREGDTTDGGPTDTPRLPGNQGSTDVPRGIGCRRRHSTQTPTVTGGTGGRAPESRCQQNEVDSDESDDLRAPADLRHRAGTLGEPDAAKGCLSGSAGRGWCSWASKTRPLTRRVPLVSRVRCRVSPRA